MGIHNGRKITRNRATAGLKSPLLVVLVGKGDLLTRSTLGEEDNGVL